MSRLVRQLFAVVLAACFAWQTGGAVRAFELDPIVHCCCGAHDAAHPCGCPHCPGVGKLRWAKNAPRPSERPRHTALRPCGGGLVLHVSQAGVRFAPVRAAGLLVPPSPSRHAVPREPLPLEGRIPETLPLPS